MRDPNSRLTRAGVWARAALLTSVFLVDRATKWWAQHWLAPRSPVVLARFFYLTYVENSGAAFGILHGSNVPLILVSSGLLIVLVYMMKRWPAEDRLSRIAIAIIIGGALGNLYDRLLYGYVVDFLDFRVWPVFNVADSCISAGAAFLVFRTGRRG